MIVHLEWKQWPEEYPGKDIPFLFYTWDGIVGVAYIHGSGWWRYRDDLALEDEVYDKVTHWAHVPVPQKHLAAKWMPNFYKEE